MLDPDDRYKSCEAEAPDPLFIPSGDSPLNIRNLDFYVLIHM